MQHLPAGVRGRGRGARPSTSAGQFGLYSAFGEGESHLLHRLEPHPQGLHRVHLPPGRPGHARPCADKDVGDIMGFRGPYGNSFPVEDWKGKDLLFIAGGIALPPMRSVIWNCLDLPGQVTATSPSSTAPAPVADLVYKHELAEWEKRPDVKLRHRRCDPGGETPGLDAARCGFVAAHRSEAASALSAPTNTHRHRLRPAHHDQVHPAGAQEARLHAGASVYTTLENRMKCGLGKCGRCNVGQASDGRPRRRAPRLDRQDRLRPPHRRADRARGGEHRGHRVRPADHDQADPAGAGEARLRQERDLHDAGEPHEVRPREVRPVQHGEKLRVQRRPGVHAGRAGEVAGGVLGPGQDRTVTPQNADYLLELRDCTGVLRWPSGELSVTATLTCDQHAKTEIVVSGVPISNTSSKLFEFFHGQSSADGCSIELRDPMSGRLVRSNRVLVWSHRNQPDGWEFRLTCTELYVTEPAGPDKSEHYRYAVRGLLCSGPHPVTAKLADLGEVTIVGPYAEAEHGGPTWGEVWVRPNEDLVGDEVDAGLDRVLDILSFAAGRSLRCSLRQRQVGGEMEWRVWPHGDIPPEMWPPFSHLNLQPLLTAAARTYTAKLGSDTGIGVAIQWLVAHSTYSPVRFVQLMIAVEHMIHAAGLRLSLFPKPVFKELSNRVLEVIDEFKQTGQGAPYGAECDALSQNVSHLNQFAFKKKIRRLLDVYRVPSDGVGEHIDDLVALRNALVHRGLEPREPERPVIEHELILREIVTRTILAILEFDGVYQSWQDGTPKNATFSRTPERTQESSFPFQRSDGR